MKRIEILRRKVGDLYGAQNQNRAEIADWLYGSHVLIVADYARELSQKLKVDNDLAEAASLLHDCADAVMSRFADTHAEKTLEISRDLLTESGYNSEEISTIVDDVIKNHSCRGSNLPKTMEGQIMATADAKAHIATDFYIWARAGAAAPPR
jgi:HD superfamily phosphodiesterase